MVHDAQLGSPDTCPSISGTYGSQVDFTGGCYMSGHADSAIISLPGSSDMDCAIDTAAVVAGDGEVALNGIDISQNAAGDARCDQFFRCVYDDPRPPWEGAITGTTEPYTYGTDLCLTWSWGTFTGPITGTITDVSSGGLGQSPTLTFDGATLQNLNPAAPDGSLTATFDLDPDTLYITVP